MKKNILFIVPCSLYPLRSGGMHAIYNGILAIQEQFNIFITYSAPHTVEEIDRKDRLQDDLGKYNISVLPYFQKQNIPTVSFARRCVNKLHHILNVIYPPEPQIGNPYSYWIDELLPQPKGYIEHVTRIISEKNIDIVQCEMLCTLSIIQQLPYQVKTIFVHHEIGFVRHYLELPNKPENNYDGESYLKCSKNLEISQLNQYNRVITLSSIDSQKLRDSGVTTPISNSFAIINQRKTKTINNKEINPFNLTFVGPDIHEPNEIGILWFLQNCWSHLQNSSNKYHLTIIGSWQEKNIKKLTSKYPNLTFSGFVDNLEKELLGTIMIVPLTVGSGIRMKILEAANIGVPFVTTAIGVEGLPLKHETDCLIADSPIDFVNAVIEMQNTSKRDRFIDNAKTVIDERYSLSALSKNRLAIYDSLYETE